MEKTMKKMITMGLVLLLLALTSCSKNNEDSIMGPQLDNDKGGEKVEKGLILDPPTTFSGGALVLNGKSLYSMNLGDVFKPDSGIDKGTSLSFHVQVQQDGVFEPFWLIQTDDFSIRVISKTQLTITRSGSRAEYITLENPLTKSMHPAYAVYDIYFSLSNSYLHPTKGFLSIAQQPFKEITPVDYNLYSNWIDMDLYNLTGSIEFVNGVDTGKMYYIKAINAPNCYKTRFELDSNLIDTTGNYSLYYSNNAPIK
jgi:hypothetical protein